jgi:hypothetical protein
MSIDPEVADRLGEEAKKRIFAAIVAYDLWQYDDVSAAVSSHGHAYTTWAMGGANEYLDALVLRAVEDMGKAKAAGAKYIAWRRKPQLKLEGDQWRLSMRFHLIPLEADKVFWEDLSARKAEGEPAKEINA